jgi:hypothetical protein
VACISQLMMHLEAVLIQSNALHLRTGIQCWVRSESQPAAAKQPSKQGQNMPHVLQATALPLLPQQKTLKGQKQGSPKPTCARMARICTISSRL